MPMRLIQALTLILVALACTPACGASAWVPNAFPPQNLRVLTDGSTSGVLRMRIEQTDLRPGDYRNQRARTLLIAGSRGRVPEARITRARFVRVSQTDTVAVMDRVPPGAGGAADTATVVRFTDMGRLRQYHVFALHLTTALQAARPGAASIPDSWLMDFIEVEVDLGPPPAETPASAADYAEPDHPVALTHLINPQIAHDYYATAPDQDWTEPEKWGRFVNASLEKGPVRRFSVYRHGLYAIGPTEAPEGAGPMEQWRLYRSGEEIPMLRDGERMLFYARPFDGVVRGREEYWLVTSPAAPASDVAPLAKGAPLRLTWAEAGPDTETTSSAATAVQLRRVLEKREQFDARIRVTANSTRWYWKSAGDGAVALFDMMLPQFFRGDSAGNFRASVTYSLSNPSVTMPAFEWLSNGRSGEVTTAPASQSVIEIPLTADVLRAGRNEVGLQTIYPEIQGDKPAVLFHGWLLSWVQDLTAPEEWVDETFAAGEGGVPASELRFGAPPARDYLLLATDSRGEPQMLRVAGESSTEPLRVRLPSSVGADAEFTLLDPARISTPSAMADASRFELYDRTEPADYIAIVHGPLMEAARPLLERRAADGHRVLAVTVQTVFDHFSFGEPDPLGMRRFLAFAYHKYPRPKVSDILLIGEASEYRGDPAEKPEGAMDDQVPIHGHPRTDTPRGDHAFALVAGPGSMADATIARIPVSTADELTSVAVKLLAYDDAPPGDWAWGAEFVSDDNDEFPRVVEDIIRDAMAPPAVSEVLKQSDFPYTINMRVPFARRSYEATERVKQMFAEGRGVVNYFGHGGPNIWSHERLFHLSDVLALRNAGRLPFVSCSSCDNAWIDYPLPPVAVSMGERLLTLPEGGAIAVFGPVGGASPYEHATQVRRLMEAIYRLNVRSMGLASLYAKNLYFADSNSAHLPDQYVLFGDPAQRLNIPVPDFAVNVAPKAIAERSRADVEVRLPAELAMTSGTLKVFRLGASSFVHRQPLVPMGESGWGAVLNASRLAAGTYGIVAEAGAGDRLRLGMGRLSVYESVPLIEGAWEGQLRAKSSGVDSASATVANPLPWDVGPVRARALFAGEAREAPGGSSDAMAGWQATPEFTLPARGRARLKLPDSGGAAPVELAVVRAGDTAPGELGRSVLLHSVGGTGAGDEHSTFALTQVMVTPDPLGNTEIPVVTGYLVNRTPDRQNHLRVIATAGGRYLGEASNVQNLDGDGSLAFTIAAREPLPEGNHELHVDVIQASTTRSTTEPVLRLTQPLPVKEGPDLAFVPDSVTVNSHDGRFTARDTVEIGFSVVNLGGTPAYNIPVHLLEGDVTTGREVKGLNDHKQVLVDALAPGETRRMQFRIEENGMTAGDKEFHLVINRSQSIREKGYENNVARLPRLRLEAMGNFTLGRVEIEPRYGSPGDEIELRYEVKYDGAHEHGPLEAETGVRNLARDRSESKRASLGMFAAGELRTVTSTVTLHVGMPSVFVKLNPASEITELTLDDNTTDTAVALIVDAEAAPAAQGTDLLPLMESANFRNMQWVPGPAVRVIEKPKREAGNIPIMPDLVTDGMITTDALRRDADEDGHWTVKPHGIEVHRGENAGPVTLRVTGPGRDRRPTYDVYAQMVTSMRLRGSQYGAFRFSLNDGPWQKRDESGTESPAYGRSIYLGRVPTRNREVTVRVEATSGSGVLISALELVPVEGQIESPVIRVPDGWRSRVARLSVETDRPLPDGVRWAWRHVNSSDRVGLIGAPWNQSEGTEIRVSALNEFLQWVLIVPPAQGEPQPIIQSVTLIPEP